MRIRFAWRTMRIGRCKRFALFSTHYHTNKAVRKQGQFLCSQIRGELLTIYSPKARVPRYNDRKTGKEEKEEIGGFDYGSIGFDCRGRPQHCGFMA